MLRVWGKLYKKGRIDRSFVAENDCSDEPESVRLADCLDKIVREFDLPEPLWLDTNKKEYENFRRTEFRAEHFFEPFAFERLEIEVIETDDKPSSNKEKRQ